MNYTKVRKELAELRDKAFNLRNEYQNDIEVLLNDCCRDCKGMLRVTRLQNNQFDVSRILINGKELFICSFNYHSSSNEYYENDEFVANLQACGYITYNSEDYMRVFNMYKIISSTFMVKCQDVISEFYQEFNSVISKISKKEELLKEWERKTETKR